MHETLFAVRTLISYPPFIVFLLLAALYHAAMGMRSGNEQVTATLNSVAIFWAVFALLCWFISSQWPV